jgi:hypothetical protein
MPSKVIAWYLPQFHPFPENDRWWGTGFTEWTLLRNWSPQFDGHRIRRPHPDIGQYSLLDRDQRRRQAEMAREYGVYGFCYYHYWFGGKQLLEKPLELMLGDGQPDIPFCLSWANESWTRRWDGLDREILQEQTYGDVDEWDRHLKRLLPFFLHRNYIKVGGKPMFLVYRLGEIPRYEERFGYWDSQLRRHGFEGIHVVMTLGSSGGNTDPLPGIGAVAEFFPNFAKVTRVLRAVRRHPRLYQIAASVWHVANRTIIRDVRATHERIAMLPRLHPTHYRGAFVGWDNSPRRGRRATIYTNCTPAAFQDHLAAQRARSDEFTFVNAWNEWSEGAVLEPDADNGYAYLEAVAQSATTEKTASSLPPAGC